MHDPMLAVVLVKEERMISFHHVIENDDGGIIV